jgi:aspartate-semialdehyde dehydrogenase
LYSHAVSVVVELEEEFSIAQIREDFANQEGLVLLDDCLNGIYPTSIASNGNDMVYVGRIRKDLSSEKSLMFYCVADNIRKGAASNAVMIAKKIIEG